MHFRYNSKIVSGSRDNTIKVWDLNTGKLLNIPKDHTSHVQCVAITSDNNKTLSGSGFFEHTIKIWDLNRGVHLDIPLSSCH